MIDIAAIFGKDYSEFCEIDPFNPQNKVNGYISRKPNDFYGALVITHINDKEVNPQLIMGSPKIHYPFESLQNGSRRYHFPIAKYIEVYEKIDGCFNYSTPILLADGTKRKIGKIVNQEEYPSVWCYNHQTQAVVIGKVTQLHKYEANTPRVMVQYEKLRGHRGNSIVCCSEDHPFLTKDGWEKAAHLQNGEIVYRFSNHLPSLMKEFLVGCLLGDSSIWLPSKTQNGEPTGNPNISFRHSTKQKEYLDLKYQLMKYWARQDPRSYMGGFDTPQWQFTTCSDSAFTELHSLFINNDGKKQVPLNIDELITPAVLSTWFLDDGSTEFNKKQRPRGQFHTEGFKFAEAERLLLTLNRRFNLCGRVKDYGKGAIIELDSDSSYRFYGLIAPYVPPCMHYKIPEEFRVGLSFWEQVKPFPKSNYGLAPTHIISVKPFNRKGISTTDNYVYDLTVEGGHSYFAGEVLVHNSNILSYRYSDGEQFYATFKTRLRPFLSSGRFGDFLNMWREAAKDYFTEIEWEMERSNCNLSFELFGSRNVHLLVYNEPLTFRLLFGVTNEGKILSPTQLKNPDLPILTPLETIDKDFATNYERIQGELQSNLKELDDGYYSGMEGTVWYLHTPEGRCIQLKNKPETIEAIHFAQGMGISKNSIIATCYNAFENTDTLTTEFIEQLLLEEFPQHQIEANHNLIEKCIQFVTGEAQFRREVLDSYKVTGMNILLQKADVMRQLSAKFNRNQMKKVYSIIAKG